MIHQNSVSIRALELKKSCEFNLVDSHPLIALELSYVKYTIGMNTLS